MVEASPPSLRDLVDDMENARLSNIAWIGQAEQHNPNSRNLPGARERRTTLAETVRWLEKLATLSASVGGDEKVEAWVDRALAKAAEAPST